MDGGVSATDVGGAYDPNLFLVDSAAIGELKHKLGSTRLAIGNAIEQLYSNVDALSNGWEGISYNTYKSNMYSYQKYLLTFCLFLDAYNNLLTELKENETVTEKNINTALEIG